MKTARVKRLLLPIGIAIVLIAYFGPSSYRKYQMDKEVDRLCKKDGGVRVFETVKLPQDKFDRFGNPDVPLSTSQPASTSPYFIETKIERLSEKSARENRFPELFRTVSRAVRAVDRRILGEAISYYRMGGDPDGPWHISSYLGCSYRGESSLRHMVFLRGG